EIVVGLVVVDEVGVGTGINEVAGAGVEHLVAVGTLHRLLQEQERLEQARLARRVRAEHASELAETHVACVLPRLEVADAEVVDHGAVSARGTSEWIT